MSMNDFEIIRLPLEKEYFKDYVTPSPQNAFTRREVEGWNLSNQETSNLLKAMESSLDNPSMFSGSSGFSDSSPRWAKFKKCFIVKSDKSGKNGKKLLGVPIAESSIPGMGIVRETIYVNNGADNGQAKVNTLTRLTANSATFKKSVVGLYRQACQEFSNISRGDCENFLKGQEYYQLHHQKKPFKVTHWIVPWEGPHRIFQLDSAYMTGLPNGLFKYIVLMIDEFTKKAWAWPVVRITSENVWKCAGPTLMNEKAISARVSGKNFIHVHTDNGTEFRDEFARQCETNNIKIRHGYPYHPWCQGLVERLVKTIKGLIYADMTRRKSREWRTEVVAILTNYNNTVHSTTGMTPNYLHEVTSQPGEKCQRVTDYMMAKYEKRGGREQDKFGNSLLRVGDLVRYQLTPIEKATERNEANNFKPQLSKKSYIANWSKNIYKITNVRRDRVTQVPIYTIRQAVMTRDGGRLIFNVDETKRKIHVFGNRVQKVFWRDWGETPEEMRGDVAIVENVKKVDEQVSVETKRATTSQESQAKSNKMKAAPPPPPPPRQLPPRSHKLPKYLSEYEVTKR